MAGTNTRQKIQESNRDDAGHAADLALQLYAANRPRFPALALRKYAGLWIAWNPEATDVLVSTADRKALQRLVCEAGQDPQRCVVERVPPAASPSK
jgi:hypothetical protein